MFNRIISTSEKIIKDVKKIIRITDLVIQGLCILFCAYNIYQHIFHQTASLIPYIVIMILSLVYFAYSIITLAKGQKRDNVILKKVVTYSKFGCRFTILIISVYDILTKEESVLSVILTIVLLAALLLQVVMEIYSYFISKYIKMIKYAISKDVDDLKVKFDGIQETFPGKLVANIIKKNSNKEPVIIDETDLPDDKDLKEVELLANKRAEEQRLIQEEKMNQEELSKQEEKKRKKEKRKGLFFPFFRHNKDKSE